jgi:L-alanine-DL-glutamate epimerase-like enolase superfamily enzyme
MKIVRVETWREAVQLSRPYTITRGTRDAVDLFFVRIVTDGTAVGIGSASPAHGVTGETTEACAAALDPARLAPLVGRDVRHIGATCAWVQDALARTPAAQAAIDIALHDVFGRWAGVPIVDVLGRHHTALPTSVTLGIQSAEGAIEAARERIAEGFTCLKVKIGLSLDEDVDRLYRLREAVGSSVRIRCDANEGYGAEGTLRFAPLLDELDIEFLEQPIPAEDLDEIRALPARLRERLALDESVQTDRDAMDLLCPEPACGTFVIKLMKSGGIRPARAIARIAESSGRGLMWGCMDESAASIAAALHAAYASPATRFLDLDGSFDLARDPAEGGFAVVQGRLEIRADAGLGVRLRD